MKKIFNKMNQIYIRFIKKNSSNKQVLNNSIALFVLQIANVLLPLITVPYLLNVLGAEKYGLVTFAIVTISFFQLVVDYGFNLTGVRQIVISKSKKEIDHIYTSIILSKLILALLVGTIYFILIYSVPYFNKNFDVYLIMLFILLSNALASNWLFQGLQKMKYITYINVSLRLVMVLMILTLVKEQSDYIVYAVIHVLVAIIIAIIGQLLITYKFNIKFVKINNKFIKKQFVEGKEIFVSTFFSNILSNAGVFFLGLIQGNAAVAYFTSAEKILKAIRLLFIPIVNALYPETNRRFEVSFLNGYNYVKKSIYIIIIPLSLMSVTLVLSSSLIYKILYEEEYWMYSPLLAIGSIWVFLSIINNFLGIQMLVGSGHGKLYSRIFMLVSGITIVLFILLSSFYTVYGVILGMIIGEGLLTLILYLNIKILCENNKEFR